MGKKEDKWGRERRQREEGRKKRRKKDGKTGRGNTEKLGEREGKKWEAVPSLHPKPLNFFCAIV